MLTSTTIIVLILQYLDPKSSVSPAWIPNPEGLASTTVPAESKALRSGTLSYETALVRIRICSGQIRSDTANVGRSRVEAIVFHRVEEGGADTLLHNRLDLSQQRWLVGDKVRLWAICIVEPMHDDTGPAVVFRPDIKREVLVNGTAEAFVIVDLVTTTGRTCVTGDGLGWDGDACFEGDDDIRRRSLRKVWLQSTRSRRSRVENNNPRRAERQRRNILDEA